MRKTAVILVFGVLAVASATCCHAFLDFMGPPPGSPPLAPEFFPGPLGPPPGPPPGCELLGPWGQPDLMEKLKLNDDQLKQMLLAYVDFKGRTRKPRNALMALHDERETMLISGKIDQPELAKLDEETAKLVSEVMNERFKLMRELLSKLTPEQTNVLSRFLAKKDIAPGPPMMGR
jgi:Spy/CpxP family protein refolding chaperone